MSNNMGEIFRNSIFCPWMEWKQGYCSPDGSNHPGETEAKATAGVSWWIVM
jgi:hypothetical protein